MRWPGLEKPGKSAVTSTAAAFLMSTRLAAAACSKSDKGPSMRTPSCDNMAFMLWVVKGTDASSPVPCKPTTKPKPINWLERCEATVVRSLTRSAQAAGVANKAPTNARHRPRRNAMSFMEVLSAKRQLRRAKSGARRWCPNRLWRHWRRRHCHGRQFGHWPSAGIGPCCWAPRLAGG